LLAALIIATASADTLHLRSGQNIEGTFLGASTNQVKFPGPDGQPKTYPLTDVDSVTFTAPPADAFSKQAASMNTRRLMTLSAAIEAATGLSLIAFPGVVGRLLLGAGLADNGIAVARLAGIALLCLGLACWPSGGNSTQTTVRALFSYNLLAALYLGYLRIGEGFVSYLLLPAFVVHALLAFLLLRPAHSRAEEKK